MEIAFVCVRVVKGHFFGHGNVDCYIVDFIHLFILSNVEMILLIDKESIRKKGNA